MVSCAEPQPARCARRHLRPAASSEISGSCSPQRSRRSRCTLRESSRRRAPPPPLTRLRPRTELLTPSPGSGTARSSSSFDRCASSRIRFSGDASRISRERGTFRALHSTLRRRPRSHVILTISIARRSSGSRGRSVVLPAEPDGSCAGAASSGCSKSRPGTSCALRRAGRRPRGRTPRDPLSSGRRRLRGIRAPRLSERVLAGDTDLFEGMRGSLPSTSRSCPSAAGVVVYRRPPGPETGAEALLLLQPKVAVPMHFGTFQTPFAPPPDDRAALAFARRRGARPKVQIRILRRARLSNSDAFHLVRTLCAGHACGWLHGPVNGRGSPRAREPRRGTHSPSPRPDLGRPR